MVDRSGSVGDAAAVGVQKMKKSRGCLGWSVAVAVEETEGEADVADEEGNATAGGLGVWWRSERERRFGLCEQRQGGLRPPLVLSVFAPREGNGSFALCQGKALCASGSSFWLQRERGQPVQQGKRKKWGLWFCFHFF